MDSDVIKYKTHPFVEDCGEEILTALKLEESSYAGFTSNLEKDSICVKYVHDYRSVFSPRPKAKRTPEITCVVVVLLFLLDLSENYLCAIRGKRTNDRSFPNRNKVHVEDGSKPTHEQRNDLTVRCLNHSAITISIGLYQIFILTS